MRLAMQCCSKTHPAKQPQLDIGAKDRLAFLGQRLILHIFVSAHFVIATALLKLRVCRQTGAQQCDSVIGQMPQCKTSRCGTQNQRTLVVYIRPQDLVSVCQ
eukprot:5963465-Amphidinium_carterae.1